MDKKEHLTMEGLQKIINIKASMNLGLSENLIKAFSNTKPVSRPYIQKSQVISPFWLAGFVEGEGCFLISIRKSSTNQIGHQVVLIYQFSQHSRDTELMKNLLEYLQVGTLIFRQNQPLVIYNITKFSDIEERIIPFFNKYSLQGVKKLEFED
jgi:hypothetical protein